ncbi:MAG: gamma-glutamyl-gamma-aminobutyrate hydrolase family protein [Verrucomicrobia bacterium]|nr:gamma-glutamyl-gamma-aminobutyrate hydrolase family protein [Verrucomicrobiota bacterium]
MIRVAVSQSVIIIPNVRERRDSLDQSWWLFLAECGIQPVIIPNHIETTMRILGSTPVAGALLTGGNDLVAYGGDAPERDKTESFVLRFCMDSRLPLLGVCRGMQFVQHYFGVPLSKVEGHVAVSQDILYNGTTRNVNSYHRWGSRESVPELEVFATAGDGVIKAIRHVFLPIVCIMWHPERSNPVDPEDEMLFRAHFNIETGK